MSDSQPNNDPYPWALMDAQPGALKFFRRRFLAATVDVIIISICCTLLLLAKWLLVEDSKIVKGAAWGVISICAAGEIVSGMTIGKWMFGLRLSRRFGLPVIIRGVVRLAPVGIFLVSLFTDDLPVAMVLWCAAGAIVLMYIVACYVLLMRRGTTLFDVAGAKVIP